MFGSSCYLPIVSIATGIWRVESSQTHSHLSSNLYMSMYSSHIGTLDNSIEELDRVSSRETVITSMTVSDTTTITRVEGINLWDTTASYYT